jgi:hypothetical protein
MGGFTQKPKSGPIKRRAAEAAAQFEKITCIFRKLRKLGPMAPETNVDKLDECEEFFSDNAAVDNCGSEAAKVVGEVEEPEYLEASKLPPWIEERDVQNERAAESPGTFSDDFFFI